jgi:hypothetical protein
MAILSTRARAAAVKKNHAAVRLADVAFVAHVTFGAGSPGEHRKHGAHTEEPASMRGRSVLLVAAGLAAGGLGVALWRQAPVRQEAPLAAASEPRSAELDELKREMASLKRVTVAQAMYAQKAAAAAPADQTKPARARPALPPAEQRRVLTELLDGRYNGESVDPSWSVGRATAIKTAFATAMPDVNVVAADCATTLCKVVVQHTDGESQAGLMERASEVEALGTETFFLFDKDATPPRTTLYMARAGEKLPRPQL